MNKEKGFTIIEVVVALVIILTIARFIWASELAAIENQIISSFGLPVWSKYLLTVPLAILWFYSFYQRQKLQTSPGQPVVRKSVIIASTITVTAVVLYLIFIVGAQNA